MSFPTFIPFSLLDKFLYGTRNVCDESVGRFGNFITESFELHLPRKQIESKVRDHVWLDEICYAAVKAKCLPAGTAESSTRGRM